MATQITTLYDVQFLDNHYEVLHDYQVSIQGAIDSAETKTQYGPVNIYIVIQVTEV